MINIIRSKMIITLLTLNLCHWVADYTHLSTDCMLEAKRFGKPLTPILVHSLVHAMLFFTCVTFLDGLLSGLLAFAIQLPTHFLIDVWKGKMSIWFNNLQNPSNKYYWWVFGVDQLLHQLVIITTAYLICY